MKDDKNTKTEEKGNGKSQRWRQRSKATLKQLLRTTLHTSRTLVHKKNAFTQMDERRIRTEARKENKGQNRKGIKGSRREDCESTSNAIITKKIKINDLL